METEKLKSIILNSPKVDNSQLLLDATILIKAFKHPFVAKYLVDLRDKYECELFTIPEVIFELARGVADSEEEYMRANEFCKEMQIAVLNLDRQFTPAQQQEIWKFTYRYSFLARKASCTDYKLCLATFRFPSFKLISGNTRDIPQELFTPIDAIVTNISHTICTDIIYQFNKKPI